MTYANRKCSEYLKKWYRNLLSCHILNLKILSTLLAHAVKDFQIEYECRVFWLFSYKSMYKPAIQLNKALSLRVINPTKLLFCLKREPKNCPFPPLTCSRPLWDCTSVWSLFLSSAKPRTPFRCWVLPGRQRPPPRSTGRWRWPRSGRESSRCDASLQQE